MTESKFHIYCVEIYDEKGNDRRICTSTMPLGFEIMSWARDFAEKHGSKKVRVEIKKVPVTVEEV